MLAAVPVELVSLRDWPPIPEPDESGDTFEQNARLKALYYDRRLAHTLPQSAQPVLTIAEDSGLVIDALDGEPGVRSARFLRADASYPERFDEIYRRLAARLPASRAARFVCAITVVRDGEPVFDTVGTIEGEMAPAPRGSHGFGYDPIFWYPPYGCTLAEVDQPAKLRVAHRGQAFRALAAWLRAQGLAQKV